MIKAVILDFDGVIVESVDIKTQAFRELFSRYTEEVEPVVRYHLQNNGVSRFIKFRHIWENILQKQYSDAVRDKLGIDFSAIVLDRVVSCPFVAGALEFLKRFYSNVPLYIASAVPEEELADIVKRKGISGYFTGKYGFPPTTKKEAISDVIRRQAIPANEILYVGDTIEDFRASSDAGTFFIARRNKEDFKGCDVPVFDDMNGVMTYVLENLKGGGL